MVQSKERAVQMTRSNQTNSGVRGRFALFLLCTCFVHDGMTRCRLRMEAFGPPHRFSPWLARTGRCANLRQKAGHDPANLPGSGGTPFGFPRQERLLPQRTRQRQLEERQGHDPTPPLKLLWSAHMYCRPPQILLEKAQDMLFREAQAIACRNLFQRDHVIQSQKPTDAGIALGIASRGPFDPNCREDQFAILLKMHVVPAADRGHSACRIGPLPLRLRLGLRLWARALQERPILGERPSRVQTDRLAVQLAILFQADQHAVSQLAAGPQHLWRAIPAIRQHDHLPLAKEGLEPPQLLDRYLTGRFLRADALDLHRRGPTARLLWQDSHQRERPSQADRLVTQRQVRPMNGPAILAGVRFQTGQRGGVHRNPDRGIDGPFGQHTAHTQPSQPFQIHLAISQRCIHTRPRVVKKRREREFGQRTSVRFAQQPIAQAKQRIGAALQTVVGLLPKLFPCVKVHEDNAPGGFCYLEHYPTRQSSASQWIACASFCLNVKLKEIQSIFRVLWISFFTSEVGFLHIFKRRLLLKQQKRAYSQDGRKARVECARCRHLWTRPKNRWRARDADADQPGSRKRSARCWRT